MGENEIVASMVTDEEKKDVIELIKDGKLDEATKLIDKINKHKQKILSDIEFKNNQKHAEPENIEEFYEQLDDIVFEFCCKMYLLESDTSPVVPNNRMRKLKQRARERITSDCGLVQNEEAQEMIMELSNKKMTVIEKILVAQRNNRELNLNENELTELMKFISSLECEIDRIKNYKIQVISQ